MKGEPQEILSTNNGFIRKNITITTYYQRNMCNKCRFITQDDLYDGVCEGCFKSKLLNGGTKK